MLRCFMRPPAAHRSPSFSTCRRDASAVLCARSAAHAYALAPVPPTVSSVRRIHTSSSCRVSSTPPLLAHTALASWRRHFSTAADNPPLPQPPPSQLPSAEVAPPSSSNATPAASPARVLPVYTAEHAVLLKLQRSKQPTDVAQLSAAVASVPDTAWDTPLLHTYLECLGRSRKGGGAADAALHAFELVGEETIAHSFSLLMRCLALDQWRPELAQRMDALRAAMQARNPPLRFVESQCAAMQPLMCLQRETAERLRRWAKEDKVWNTLSPTLRRKIEATASPSSAASAAPSTLAAPAAHSAAKQPKSKSSARTLPTDEFALTGRLLMLRNRRDPPLTAVQIEAVVSRLSPASWSLPGLHAYLDCYIKAHGAELAMRTFDFVTLPSSAPDAVARTVVKPTASTYMRLLRAICFDAERVKVVTLMQRVRERMLAQRPRIRFTKANLDAIGSHCDNLPHAKGLLKAWAVQDSKPLAPAAAAADAVSPVPLLPISPLVDAVAAPSSALVPDSAVATSAAAASALPAKTVKLKPARSSSALPAATAMPTVSKSKAKKKAQSKQVVASSSGTEAIAMLTADAQLSGSDVALLQQTPAATNSTKVSKAAKRKKRSGTAAAVATIENTAVPAVAAVLPNADAASILAPDSAASVSSSLPAPNASSSVSDPARPATLAGLLGIAAVDAAATALTPRKQRVVTTAVVPRKRAALKAVPPVAKLPSVAKISSTTKKHTASAPPTTRTSNASSPAGTNGATAATASVVSAAASAASATSAPVPAGRRSRKSSSPSLPEMDAAASAPREDVSPSMVAATVESASSPHAPPPALSSSGELLVERLESLRDGAEWFDSSRVESVVARFAPAAWSRTALHLYLSCYTATPGSDVALRTFERVCPDASESVEDGSPASSITANASTFALLICALARDWREAVHASRVSSLRARMERLSPPLRFEASHIGVMLPLAKRHASLRSCLRAWALSDGALENASLHLRAQLHELEAQESNNPPQQPQSSEMPEQSENTSPAAPASSAPAASDAPPAVTSLNALERPLRKQKQQKRSQQQPDTSMPSPASVPSAALRALRDFHADHEAMLAQGRA